jgi:3-phosphoinositide dependent protein kinase-1
MPAGSLVSGISNLYAYHVNRQQFLDPGESVLMISMVKKIQKLSSKKVQLILTNKPKLIYVDPSKLIVKGNIIWSDNPNDLSVQVTSPSHFKICTVCTLYSMLYHNQGFRGIFHFHSTP